jgi:aminopeptidase N
MLRHQVGTETFWEGIRRYYARYYNGHATTAQFRAVMEEVSGQDLELFFQQWLYQGSAGLILDGTWSYNAPTPGAESGTVELDIEQVQPGGTTYAMPVTLRLVGADGTTADHTVELTEERQTVTLAAEFAPASIVIDPDVWLLIRGEISER